MSPPAIETNDLRKVFGSGLTGEEVAVDELSLTVPQGTIYGFLGPNGAGKTTTMRMLTTLTRPTAGSARVAGASVEDRDAVVDHIAFLPEEPPVYAELTGREQLDYVAGLRDVDAEDRIEELLDRFALAEDADRRVGAYSKGMTRKLGLIQAMLADPDVLFLDEPTSGLDPRAARTVRDEIAALGGSGTTVFLSTHILPVVEELADEVGVLADGQLVAEGSPAELTSRLEAGEGSLEDVFLSVTTAENDPAPAAGAGRNGGGSGSNAARDDGGSDADDGDSGADDGGSDGDDGDDPDGALFADGPGEE